MQRFIPALMGVLFLCPSGSHCAEITSDTVAGFSFISVAGQLVAGDEERFASVSKAIENATVMLEGPGGLAGVGMAIGRAIALRGFSTAVGADSVCASACGLIWIAGKERFLRPTSLVGFHAIYRAPNGTPQVSSDGNALVGAYLRELGFSDPLIVYATQAPPNSMQWLTFDDATKFGLNVTRVDKDPHGAQLTASSTDLGINSAYLYVETQAGASPSVYPATVHWTAADNEIPEFGVQRELNGAIAVPQLGLQASFDIAPNTLPELPASHLIRLQPFYPSGYIGFRISSIQGVALKITEAERGDLLSGVTGTLADGFVLATNTTQNELARNLDLLSRPWVDVQVTFEGGIRALITLEIAGRARDGFDSALLDWRNHAFEAEQ
jgi:hypothetical protein